VEVRVIFLIAMVVLSKRALIYCAINLTIKIFYKHSMLLLLI